MSGLQNDNRAYTEKDLGVLYLWLEEAADEKYRQFNESLIPGTGNKSMGVRLPLLRAFAKELTQGDWRGFLLLSGDEKIYEMKILSGLVIAGADCSFSERLSFLAEFIPRIDSWAVCDTLCCSLKSIKKNRERMLEFLQPYLISGNEFELRFAAVILMDYYIDEKMLDFVLSWYGAVRHDGYYVKMAVAWGLSVCFIKFRDRTLDFLKSGRLDDETWHMTLRKIRDSYRVSAEDKEMLRNLKGCIRKDT